MSLFTTNLGILRLTLLCVFSVGNVRAAETGNSFERIFTVKSERKAIDRMRLSSGETKAKVLEKEIVSGQEGDTQQVKFSGYITKQDGSKLYWLEGMTELGEIAKDIKVESQTNHVVFSTVKSRAALKPGQVWLIDKQKIIENYEVDTLEVPEDDGESQDTKEDEVKTQI